MQPITINITINITPDGVEFETEQEEEDEETELLPGGVGCWLTDGEDEYEEIDGDKIIFGPWFGKGE